MRHVYLSLTACLLLFASCYGDKGNYTYTDVDRVTITGIPDSINRIAFIDALEIRPQITSTLYGEKLDNYKYRWIVIPSGADEINTGEVDYTISEEKDLILPTVTFSTGTYSCLYVVRDTVNGIEWREDFQMQIRQFTSEGWLVLCDDDGKGRLDIIVNTYDDEAKEYIDLLAYNMWEYNELVTHNPQRLLYSYQRGNRNGLMYVCDEGTFFLDNDDLYVTEGGNVRWYFGGKPDRVHLLASGIGTSGGERNWMVIDEDKNVYLLNTVEGGAVFMNPINYINGDREQYFEPAPFVGISIDMSNWTYENASMMLYDATNQRFLEMKKGARYPSVMVFDSQLYFTAETGYDMVYLQSTLPTYNYAILKDPVTGKYYYYQIRMGKDGKNEQIRHGEVKGPDLDKVKFFACQNQEAQPYLFYATENNDVYMFLMGENSVEAHKVLSFQDETVAALKFTAFYTWGKFADWEKDRNYQLLVATNKTSGPEDECGIVRMYETPSPFGTVRQVKEHIGFGKIVDVTYMQRQR